MTIYNINLGIGWASSGVEYAQVYRAQMLRNINEEVKFIFMDFINAENIQTYTENIGFKDEEIIWLYQYFTDIKIARTSFTVNDLLEQLNANKLRSIQKGKVKIFYLDGDHTFLRCYLKDEQQDVMDRVEYVVNQKVIRKDFYSYTKFCSEYYAPDNGAKLYLRQYYNENGTVAYREHIDGDNSMFEIGDVKLYSKQEFVAYFMQCLKLTQDDIVILDRGKNIAQAVIQNKGNSKLGVVVHAEHYSANNTTDEVVLWNNFYEYQFINHRHIDFFITATERQNNTLMAQFKKYLDVSPKIYTIPVGSLKTLQKNNQRKPYSLITASRLAKEKHLDWLILAVVKAKAHIHALSFDIYGEGSQRQMLEALIHKHQASDYIQLKGHVNLEKIYPLYEAFISGSTSEGFGLTLMEAIGSGLGMIGLNVEYGNPTFIDAHHNGLLIDYHNESSDEVIDKLSQAIITLFNSDMNYSKRSYEIAEAFLSEVTEQKWKNLIEAVRHD
ncbi:accessory Sec system glycosyltransferase GtfA [Macrococcoides caseolyticum]|uniref:accessory Sec system glycosyltransferase GtfA n=1 Tax=Macrococcoides caseolyticum TaxID=69966 RepID=UPI001F2AFC1C|nr:accessory Sec system glycosyltransferase GtfA [Macrococcus caseolyticus]MCE4957791.1 accessory Sec system glycosyltransferase GtfA [Macrococcus caseolyticus]